MGRFFVPVTVLLAALLPATAVQAQQPLDAPPFDSSTTSLQAPPCTYLPLQPTPAAVTCAQPGCCGCDREPPFAIELMLGQAIGIRGQVSVYRNNFEAVVVEGFYGELFHNLGSAQALGTGARYLLRTNWPDCCDAIHFGPGLDVFFQLNHNDLILLTPSVDVAWLHNLGGGLEWELGLELGLGIGVSGHTSHGHSAAGDVTPLISVYTGLRF
jgi:hypothetical protein